MDTKLQVPHPITETLYAGPPPVSVQWVPLAEGVTLSVALGAGPVAVAAVGNAVSVTSLVAGTTTVAQVQAAIAGDPAVAALVRLDGVAATVFPATYAGLVVTAMDRSQTTQHSVAGGLRPDGTFGPLRLDANGHLVVDIEPGDTITETNSAAIAASTAAIEAAIGDHDATTDTEGVRVLGVAYSDPASLPADVSANGDDCHMATSRKGEVMVYPSRLSAGEDSSRGVLRVERQPTASADLTASAIVVAAGTPGRVYGVLASVTVAATVRLRADAVVAGAILKEWALPVGVYSLDHFGLSYGNGLYLEVAAGTCTVVVLYRNDA